MSINRIDEHKLIFHPERVAQWSKHGDCFPIYIEIGLTNRCNHKCVFCALDWLEHSSIDIDSDIMLKALKDMAQHGVRSIMFAGEGEPLLHKEAPIFFKYAKDCGLKVALTTNGVPFGSQKMEVSLPHLSWIRFSVNAGTAKQYAKVHNTIPEDFDRVIANIKRTVEFKKQESLDVDIGVQVLIIPESIESIVKLAEITKDIGVDNLQIKPYSQHPLSKNRFIINYEDYLNLEPIVKAFESSTFHIFFRNNTIQRLINHPDYDHCYGLPFFALINAKGQIIPCNLFYDDPELIYGDLNNETFSEIWNGRKRKRVLEILATKDIRDCRQICRLDPINRYLNRLKHPGPRDDFI
jgi:radical SAM protein with 4Fe4S-binding SPASM domain